MKRLHSDLLLERLFDREKRGKLAEDWPLDEDQDTTVPPEWVKVAPEVKPSREQIPPAAFRDGVATLGLSAPE